MEELAELAVKNIKKGILEILETRLSLVRLAVYGDQVAMGMALAIAELSMTLVSASPEDVDWLEEVTKQHEKDYKEAVDVAAGISAKYVAEGAEEYLKGLS